MGFGLDYKGSKLNFFGPDLVPLMIGGYLFPMECLVDVRARKRIVKTEVPGLKSTIKELTGFEDYEITVHAVFQTTSYDDTQSELKDLIEIWKKKESLFIYCPKTDLYDINYVVFEGISHPETQGMEATERLTLNFISDIDYDFEVEF